jgi:hypothetical protein
VRAALEGCAALAFVEGPGGIEKSQLLAAVRERADGTPTSLARVVQLCERARNPHNSHGAARQTGAVSRGG